MKEGCAMDESLDGEAISRADREFLASLDEHPLRWNPLYGTPCPLQPDFGPFDPKDKDQTAERLNFFAGVVNWMLANYAYREGAFLSKGGAISLVDGEVIALADLRGRMAPWALIHIGPRGGIKTRSPVEDWMMAKTRHSIRREETRPDQQRPTFTEDGYAISGRRRTQRAGAIPRRSRPSSRISCPTRRKGHGCGTGWRTKRAGHGCRWSR
jgi:hypothetical protein